MSRADLSDDDEDDVSASTSASGGSGMAMMTMAPRQAYDQIIAYIVDQTAMEPFPPIPPDQAAQICATDTQRFFHIYTRGLECTATSAIPNCLRIHWG